MANPEHVSIVRQGWKAILDWRGCNGAPLDLSGADLTYANLAGADLRDANLQRADLTGANVSEARLSGADLRDALLQHADLSDADLGGADLRGASLRGAALVHTNLNGANLSDCQIFGMSAWDVSLDGATQKNLEITPFGSSLKIDDIEVAQFAYLLLQNKKIGRALSTITSKAVLILGNFAEERKRVLDAIRDELREHGYLAMIFDFGLPIGLSYDETVTTLARMSRFVVADVTDAREIRAELTSIVPDLPSVPICVLLQEGEEEWRTFGRNFRNRPSVLPLRRYRDMEDLLANIEDGIIGPAERLAIQLRGP